MQRFLMAQFVSLDRQLRSGEFQIRTSKMANSNFEFEANSNFEFAFDFEVRYNFNFNLNLDFAIIWICL